MNLEMMDKKLKMAFVEICPHRLGIFFSNLLCGPPSEEISPLYPPIIGQYNELDISCLYLKEFIFVCHTIMIYEVLAWLSTSPTSRQHCGTSKFKHYWSNCSLLKGVRDDTPFSSQVLVLD